jgi:hypothetical protein
VSRFAGRGLGALALAALLQAAPAQAGTGIDGDVSAAGRPRANEVVETGVFLSGMQPAAASVVAGSAVGLTGYDSARQTTLFALTGDVRLLSWLALRAGVYYNPSDNTGDDRSRARPAVSLRAHLASQDRAGVDVAVAAAYRQERFNEDGGLLDLTAAVGRRFGRVSLLGNVGAAADPEGDDFEGQVGAAALVRTTTRLSVGGQGFFRRDLGSTDPRRATRNGETYDFAAGPVAVYAPDVFVFSLQAGVVGVRARESAVGLLALAGVGAVF